MAMRLYHFSWGLYPRRVTIYLAEKRLTIDEVYVDITKHEQKSPWFAKLNPAKSVPVLETDSGLCITQANSIIEYIEELHPTPSLIGTTSEARAMTRDRTNLLNVSYWLALSYAVHAGNFGRDIPHIAAMLAKTHDPKAAALGFRAEHVRQLEVLESLVGDDDYMGGASPDVADIVFFASAQYMDLFYGVDLPESCPRLQAIYERFSHRPSAAPPQYPEDLAISAIVPGGRRARKE